MRLITLAVACGALAVSACGTITRGSDDTWEISTSPIGAQVETTNGYTCDATPCAIKMPRRSEFVATVTLDGYEPATVSVTHQVSNAGGASMAGNVLVGGLIGAAVDANTGAMNDLVPNPVHLDLVPITETEDMEDMDAASEGETVMEAEESEDAGSETTSR